MFQQTPRQRSSTPPRNNFSVRNIRIGLFDFSSFALSISKEEYVAEAYGPLDVPRENPPLLLAFEYLYPDLRDLARDAGPTDYLDDLGRRDGLCGLLAHCYLVPAPAAGAAWPLILASSWVTWSRICWPSPASRTAAAAVETSIPIAGPIWSFEGTKT